MIIAPNPASPPIHLARYRFSRTGIKNASVFPHTLLIADELAKVTVIEHFRSAHPDRAGFACGVNDLVVRRGAKLNYICTQNWNEKVLAIQDYLANGDFTYDQHVSGAYDVRTLVNFLTHTKRGFCQQFASAMAVLVRSLGYPARVATGFTPGDTARA